MRRGRPCHSRCHTHEGANELAFGLSRNAPGHNTFDCPPIPPSPSDTSFSHLRASPPRRGCVVCKQRLAAAQGGLGRPSALQTCPHTRPGVASSSRPPAAGARAPSTRHPPNVVPLVPPAGINVPQPSPSPSQSALHGYQHLEGPFDATTGERVAPGDGTQRSRQQQKQEVEEPALRVIDLGAKPTAPKVCCRHRVLPAAVRMYDGQPAPVKPAVHLVQPVQQHPGTAGPSSSGEPHAPSRRVPSTSAVAAAAQKNGGRNGGTVTALNAAELARVQEVMDEQLGPMLSQPVECMGTSADHRMGLYRVMGRRGRATLGRPLPFFGRPVSVCAGTGVTVRGPGMTGGAASSSGNGEGVFAQQTRLDPRKGPWPIPPEAFEKGSTVARIRQGGAAIPRAPLVERLSASVSRLSQHALRGKYVSALYKYVGGTPDPVSTTNRASAQEDLPQRLVGALSTLPASYAQRFRFVADAAMQTDDGAPRAPTGWSTTQIASTRPSNLKSTRVPREAPLYPAASTVAWNQTATQARGVSTASGTTAQARPPQQGTLPPPPPPQNHQHAQYARLEESVKQLQQVVSDLHKTTLADEEEEFPGSALRVPPPQTPPPPVQALMMLDRLAHAMEEEYTKLSGSASTEPTAPTEPVRSTRVPHQQPQYAPPARTQRVPRQEQHGGPQPQDTHSPLVRGAPVPAPTRTAVATRATAERRTSNEAEHGVAPRALPTALASSQGGQPSAVRAPATAPASSTPRPAAAAVQPSDLPPHPRTVSTSHTHTFSYSVAQASSSAEVLNATQVLQLQGHEAELRAVQADTAGWHQSNLVDAASRDFSGRGERPRPTGSDQPAVEDSVPATQPSHQQLHTRPPAIPTAAPTTRPTAPVVATSTSTTGDAVAARGGFAEDLIRETFPQVEEVSATHDENHSLASETGSAIFDASNASVVPMTMGDLHALEREVESEHARLVGLGFLAPTPPHPQP